MLAAQIRAPNRDCFQALIDAYASKQAQTTPGLAVIVSEKAAEFVTQSQEEVGNTPGTFVASNVWPAGKEAFAESVATTAEERHAQWLVVVASGAAQRLCRVFSE